MGELSAPGDQACHRGTTAKFPDLTMVPATRGFRVKGREVGLERSTGARRSSKAKQCRLIHVSTCVTAHDGTGQQGLAPKGNKALRIEIPWMQGPETHGARVEEGKPNGCKRW